MSLELGAYVEEARPDGATYEPRRGYVIATETARDGMPTARLLRFQRHAGDITALTFTLELEAMDPTTGDPPDARARGLLRRELAEYRGRRRPGAKHRPIWSPLELGLLAVLVRLSRDLSQAGGTVSAPNQTPAQRPGESR